MRGQQRDLTCCLGQVATIDGLLGEQGGDDRQAHRRAPDGIGAVPSQPGGEEQDQGVTGENSEAVSELERGSQQRLILVAFGAFDPPGVHDGILGGRGEGGDQGGDAQHCETALGSDDRHSDERQADEALGQQHPATPPPEPAEEGHVEPVDYGRPQEFERIGQTNPGDEADRGQLHTAFAQPKA